VSDLATLMQLIALHLKVPEGYISFMEELLGANTQDETLEKARINLQETIQLILDINRQ
jgi:predicted RNase H-like HicB family nuclease